MPGAPSARTIPPTGDAWAYFPHDHARSRAYRWNEDGLAGFCNRFQNLCLCLALWNGRDPILKERLFGLANEEGNHGEDVKEYYYYLDGVPSHAYMRMLYKYPQVEYPYARLVAESRRRSRTEPEFELVDAIGDALRRAATSTSSSSTPRPTRRTCSAASRRSTAVPSRPSCTSCRRRGFATPGAGATTRAVPLCGPTAWDRAADLGLGPDREPFRIRAVVPLAWEGTPLPGPGPARLPAGGTTLARRCDRSRMSA